MLGVGILYHDPEKDKDGVVLLSDRNILIGPHTNLTYEAQNVMPVSEDPSVAFVFPGVATAIQRDFALRTSQFLEGEKIKNCAEFSNKFFKLYYRFREMANFYTQGGRNGTMLDFLIGITDSYGMAEIYYVKVGDPMEFELLGTHSKYAVTAFGRGEVGLFVREIVGAFLKDMRIIPPEPAIEIGLTALTIAERFYRDISPKVDICRLSDGKYVHYPDEIAQGLYSDANAKIDVMFQLLFDLIHYPEKSNVEKILKMIIGR